MAKAQSSQVTVAFDNAIKQQRVSDLARAAALIAEGSQQLSDVRDQGSPALSPGVNPRTKSYRTHNRRLAEYEEITEEFAAATSQFVDPESGVGDKKDTMRLYRGLCLQADHIDRQRRAKFLLHSRRSRRKVHAAARRLAHGMTGGLFDRVYVGEVLQTLR